jgi:hypothetical protein
VEVRLRKLREGILGCVGRYVASCISALLCDVGYGLRGCLRVDR